MIRRIHTILILTAFSGMLLFSACAQEPAWQETPQPAVPPTPQSVAPASLDEQINQVKADLQKVKRAMANEGEYLCCVKPACDWCMLKEGKCKCRENLEDGQAVCAGCGLGWHNGQGDVYGVKADQVKWNITHSHGESGGHEH